MLNPRFVLVLLFSISYVGKFFRLAIVVFPFVVVAFVSNDDDDDDDNNNDDDDDVVVSPTINELLQGVRKEK